MRSYRLIGRSLPLNLSLSAIAIGILLLLCIMMSVRRRRHGQTFLPGPAGRIGGGFVRPAAPSTNYNNGVYGSSPYGQYGQQQGSTTYNGPYAPQARPNTPPPPPPYTGKAEEPANGAPHADEYAPPPGPPPEAHVNGGVSRNTFYLINRPDLFPCRDVTRGSKEVSEGGKILDALGSGCL